MSTITPSAGLTVNPNTTVGDVEKFALGAGEKIMYGRRDKDRNLVLYFAGKSSGSVGSKPAKFQTARLEMRAKAARDGLLEIAKNTLPSNASTTEKLIAAAIYSNKDSLPKEIQRDSFLEFVGDVKNKHPQSHLGRNQRGSEFDKQLSILRDNNVNNRPSLVLANGEKGSNAENGQAVSKSPTVKPQKNKSPQPETREFTSPTAITDNTRRAVGDCDTTQENHKVGAGRPRANSFHVAQSPVKPVGKPSTPAAGRTIVPAAGRTIAPKDQEGPSDKLDFNELMKGPGIGALISGAVSKVFSSVSGLVSSFVDFLSRLTEKSKFTLEDEKSPPARMTIKVPGLEGTKKGDVKRLMYQNNKILEFLRTEKGQAALAQEGLFRVPGGAIKVNELREKEIMDFSKYEHKSDYINCLSSLFKGNATEIATSSKYKGQIEEFQKTFELEISKALQGAKEVSIDPQKVPESIMAVVDMVTLTYAHSKVTRAAGSQICTLLASSLWGNSATLADHKKNENLTGKLLQALVKDFNPLEKRFEGNGTAKR